MEALLVLPALAIPLAGIVAFFLVVGARRRLLLVEERLAELHAAFVSQGSVPPRAAPVDPSAYWADAAVQPERREDPAPDAAQGTAAAAAAAELHPEPLRADVAAEEAAGREATPPPPPPPPADTEDRIAGFEERFGTRWVVWVGGLALALGGIFLVRYSIEQGLVGPGVRTFMGALLAAGLIAAGEWTRRADRQTEAEAQGSAYIPGILTAAGITVAYATVYAAYALYGFLPPPVAFVLLGAVALATLAAALLHGPALAGLGVVGAFVTPLLVASSAPNFWALYIYLGVVSAAAMALARIRLWRWLALTAVILGALWTIPSIGVPIMLGAHLFHVLLGFALVCAFMVPGLALGPSAGEPGHIDPVSTVALGAYLAAAALLTLLHFQATLPLLAFAILLAATVAVAWRSEAATGVLPIAGALAVLLVADWALRINAGSYVAPAGLAGGPEPQALDLRHPLLFGGFAAVLFGAAGFLAQGRSARALAPILWAGTGVFTPLAILAALHYRIAAFDRSIPFAAVALLAAALYGIAVEAMGKREARPGSASAAALCAVGSVAGLALALTFALEKGWLTIALALMVPGVAWIAERRPLPMLRVLAAVLATLVAVRIGWEPRIIGTDVGRTPIFNWLLYGYGVPALGFWVAGHVLRRRGDDLPVRIVESLAIVFTVLLFALQIRHYVNNGDLYGDVIPLQEIALHVIVGLGMAIGLEHVRARTGSVIHNVAAILLAAAAAFGIVFGLWVAENPLFSGEPVEGRFFNVLLLAYGIPALLAITLAIRARHTRPIGYRVAATIVAVLTAMLYLSLQVRRIYQGPDLSVGATTQAEQYTYSVVWLAFGVVLLLVGIALRSQPARLVSAAVLVATVAKVFLIDLADLQGVYRALSFIGLGAVLVGIGLIYQRLLFPRRRVAAVVPQPEAPPV